MPKTLSTPERLDLLLAWLNDEDGRMPSEEVCERLRRFVDSFDGSEAAGFVRVIPDPRQTPPDFLLRKPLFEQFQGEDDELSMLRFALVDLLRRGFAPEPNYVPPTLPHGIGLESLHLDINRIAQTRASLIPTRGTTREDRRRLTRERRRLAGRPGAYVLCVAGNRFDLARFLCMHLLTTPGSLALSRCPAPAPHSKERCGKFFLVGGKGPPRKFCSETCRQRNYWEIDEAVHRGRAAAKRRRRRRRRT
jgi:hypothetical protein